MPGESDKVFLIEDETLRPLPSRPWRVGLFGKTLEESLQVLIEKYPEVLPGRQMDPGSDDPPHFALLCREMPVAGWSLDHLLVDQRGVLTLVEAKLIQHPESRRDVVGQLMDYAANAARAWANGKARQKATEYWDRQRRQAVDDVIRKKLGEDIDVEDLWVKVEESSGRRSN